MLNARSMFEVEHLEDRRLLTAVTIDPAPTTESDLNAVFHVHLDAPATHDIQLGYTTLPGTARPGKDFQTKRGILTIPQGQTNADVLVPLVPDNVYEGDETIRLLMQPMGAANRDVTPRRLTSTLTVTDNLAAPVVSVGPVAGGLTTFAEPARGRSFATLTVSISHAASKPVLVQYATADGTATAGLDYLPAHGRIVFAPGQTSRTIRVPLKSDRIAEGAEDFLVNLSAPSTNATIGFGSQLVSIDSNGADGQPLLP